MASWPILGNRRRGKHRLMAKKPAMLPAFGRVGTLTWRRAVDGMMIDRDCMVRKARRKRGKQNRKMRIQELRELIESYSADQLRPIIGEIYKRIPKKVIGEKGIDELLKDPKKALSIRKERRKTIEPGHFGAVKLEVEHFLDNANRQYYFAPNRFVPKKERPKWRFTAKRLRKELLLLSQDRQHLAEVDDLLTRLYGLLCRACGEWLFSSTDPFRAVGVAQTEFYADVVALKKRAGRGTEWTAPAVVTLIDNTLDSSTTNSDLIEVLLEFLDTAPLKEEAIAQCDRLLRENEDAAPAKDRDGKGYAVEERGKVLVECVFRLQMALAEHEAAVDYFKSHYVGFDEADRLNALLWMLFRLRLKDLWLREYEAGVEKGLEVWPSLRRIYQSIKKAGDFPVFVVV